MGFCQGGKPQLFESIVGIGDEFSEEDISATTSGFRMYDEMARNGPVRVETVDDDLAQASNITLHAGQLSSRSAGESMSGTDLIRVLLLAVLGEDGERADTERQEGTEQPHGWGERRSSTTATRGCYAGG